MSDLTPDPKDFEEDHFPIRGGDWLMNDSQEIAQVKGVYVDKDYSDESLEFLVDLIFYDENGRRIGRKSDNLPFVIDGKKHYGPRSYEPCCSLEGWHRVQKPNFPLNRSWMPYPDPERPGVEIARYQYDVTRRGWGNYVKRKRAVRIAPVTSKPNFDPELERRARKLAAEILRDNGHKELAAQLEREAEQF